MVNVSFILLTLGILRDIVKWLRAGDIYKNIGKKLINWFLAGLFIPLSWFIVGALVDLSTILIYQVGSIPLTVMQESDKTNIKILNNHSQINLADPLGGQSQDAWGLRFKTIYSCGDTYFAVCKFEGQKMTTENWNKYLEEVKTNYPWKNISSDYCAYTPTTLMSTKSDIDYSQQDSPSLKAALEQGVGGMAWCDTVKNLIEQSKSMVWPLYTIYWSLLNFTSLNITTSWKSTEAEVMLFLIKWIVWLLLVIPLIGLAVTSIARVALLWLVISFSPFIALYKFMGKDNKMIGDVGWKDGISFNRWKGLIDFSPDLSGVIQLIFNPVLVVFALGVSLIFLSATNKMLWPTATEDGLLQAVGIELDRDSEPGYQTFKVSNNNKETTSISIKSFDGEYATSIFFDYFTWILSNMLGILVMRFLMFAALKSSKMTKALGEKVQNVGRDYLQTRPIFGWFTYKTLSTQTPEFINDVWKYYTKDATEQAGKDLFANIKDNMPGSAKSKEFDSKFAIGNDELAGKTPEVKNTLQADKFMSAIGGQDRNTNHQTFDTKNSEGLKKIMTDNGVSAKDIAGMVKDDKFWTNIVMKSTDPNKFMSDLTKIASGSKDGKELAEKRVGKYPDKVMALTEAAKTGLTTNPIVKSGTLIKNETAWYYRDKNNKLIYNYTMGKESTGEPSKQIQSINKTNLNGLENKPANEKASMLNNISADKDLAAKLASEYNIPTAATAEKVKELKEDTAYFTGERFSYTPPKEKPE